MQAFGKAHPGTEFTVAWRPFQLNPTAHPTREVNKWEYYIEKFGKQRAEQMLPSMKHAGKSVGITFSYGGNLGNTRESHRLILLAEKQGLAVQDRLVEELFKNYFEEEKWIGSPAVLEAAAKKAGVQDFERLKENPEFLSAELSAELESVRGSINGVPHFIVDGKYEISGAQEAETFQELFQKICSKQ